MQVRSPEEFAAYLTVCVSGYTSSRSGSDLFSLSCRALEGIWASYIQLSLVFSDKARSKCPQRSLLTNKVALYFPVWGTDNSDACHVLIALFVCVNQGSRSLIHKEERTNITARQNPLTQLENVLDIPIQISNQRVWVSKSETASVSPIHTHHSNISSRV